MVDQTHPYINDKCHGHNLIVKNLTLMFKIDLHCNNIKLKQLAPHEEWMQPQQKSLWEPLIIICILYT